MVHKGMWDCLMQGFHRSRVGVWSPGSTPNRERKRPKQCREKPAIFLGESSSSLKVQNFRYGRLNVLRWLLWETEMPALERSGNGALALHYAAARGCLDCVKLLVESSTELSANTQMDNDVTPVYLAAQEGHLEVLKFLVKEAGGSLYVRAKDGMAPLHAASQMGCLLCLKWMIQDQGVDPDLRDGDGATPLHFAASRGHTETVRWLLRHGARLILDQFGKSPIDDAAENQQIECLNILVQHGATADYADQLQMASASSHVCTCRKLETSQPKCLYSDCVNRPGASREPFFLHPPTVHQQDGLYVNPMTGDDPFYLHNPQEVVYNRVKDLFESTPSPRANSITVPPPPPMGGLTVAVKVEVHNGSAGPASEENMSCSDFSERSADPENDYEEIYQSTMEPAVSNKRKSTASSDAGAPASTTAGGRDSGSHSRSTSGTSNVIVSAEKRPEDEPSMTGSAESGVSSCAASDTDHCEEAKQPGQHASYPDDSISTGDDIPQNPTIEVVEEPTLKPSVLLKSGPQQRYSINSKKSTSSSSSSVVEDDKQTGPHLVNKQMVLPFIPPKFPSGASESNSLIKPSEYLRSLGSNLAGVIKVAPSAEKTQDSQTQEEEEYNYHHHHQQQQQPCLGPPPPPLPDLAASPSSDQATSISPVSARKQQQPLGAISIQDLNSVQLRRTDKMIASKTLSAPALSRPTPLQNGGDQPFLLSQKADLIEELKLSKDITGIKKLKVERAKVEEQQEKEHFSEITKQLTVNSFVEKIPDKDAIGNPIPIWKRQMMAKKAAERARKELEEQMLKEAEEKRLQSIPPWKRQLLAKKEETGSDIRKTTLYTPRIIEDKKTKTAKPEEILKKVASDQLSSTTAGEISEESNKENKTPMHQTPQQEVQQQTSAKKPEHDAEDTAQIIPWRAQLRKTNSKLSLLE